jgi:hypothetical protein
MGFHGIAWFKNQNQWDDHKKGQSDYGLGTPIFALHLELGRYSPRTNHKHGNCRISSVNKWLRLSSLFVPIGSSLVRTDSDGALEWTRLVFENSTADLDAGDADRRVHA